MAWFVFFQLVFDFAVIASLLLHRHDLYWQRGD